MKIDIMRRRVVVIVLVFDILIPIMNAAARKCKLKVETAI